MIFGEYICEHLEASKVRESAVSIRQVAQRIGVEFDSLSKIERKDVAPPSEVIFRVLAEELGENPDVLLAKPVGASQFQMWNHFHSMVAGGFPEISYVTRLMPRTSLMIRPDMVASTS